MRVLRIVIFHLGERANVPRLGGLLRARDRRPSQQGADERCDKLTTFHLAISKSSRQRVLWQKTLNSTYDITASWIARQWRTRFGCAVTNCLSGVSMS